MQNGNREYDAWLLWNINRECNLDCTYCRSRQWRKGKRRATAGPKEINIEKVLRALGRTGRIFRISLSSAGGEPFLVPNITELCLAITEKHFLSLSTNLTPAKVKEFAGKINPQRVIKIIASLHIKELERLNLMDRFVSNFLLCKEKGFNIHALECAYPPLLKEVDMYKKFFEGKGVKLEFNVFCGEYNGKDYPASYTEEELKTFGLAGRPRIKGYESKGKICNAGYNAAKVKTSGDIIPCYQIRENMGNIYEDIRFRDRLIECPYEHCTGPLKDFDPYLFEKALAAVPE